MTTVTTTAVQTISGRTISVSSPEEAMRVINMDRIAHADAEIERLKAVRAAAIEGLYDSFGSTGKHVVPGVGEITFSDNNVYDAKTMKDALKPGQFMRVSERKLVPARVKELYPSVYADAKSYRGYRAAVNIYDV